VNETQKTVCDCLDTSAEIGFLSIQWPLLWGGHPYSWQKTRIIL